MDNQQTQLVKLDVCLYKNKDTSYEDFADFVNKVYAPKAVPIMKQFGIVQWSSTMHPPSYREPQRQAARQMGRDQWTVPDYDVTMSYWLRSMDDMRNMVASVEWAELEKEARARGDMRIGHFIIGEQIVHFGSEEANGRPAYS